MSTIPERLTKVLVVDDEEQIRRALRSILRTRRYQVDEAATGEAALLAAIDQPPDLVILDLMLPDMSGIDVCRGAAYLARGPHPRPVRSEPRRPTRCAPSTRAPTTT